jgi:hypothetical protein
MSTVPNEELKKAIEIIKKNKEFFAEYLKRERDQEQLEIEGDLREGDDWEGNAPRMMPYIFQWEQTLKSNKKTYGEYYVAYRTLRNTVQSILTKNSIPASATEKLRGLSATEKERLEKGEEPRLKERAINRTVEHNNALSETIKGALYYLNYPYTKEAGLIRPHDYLWRYRAHNRLDKFLQDVPEFVSFLIENEETIDKLGDSYKQWWSSHKRKGLLGPPPHTAEDQAQKSENALQLSRLWYRERVGAPPTVDINGNIIPVTFFKGTSRFKQISETEEFSMRLVYKDAKEVKFSDFKITRTSDGYYSIDNQKMRKIDELIEFAKTKLPPTIHPLEDTPVLLMSNSLNTVVKKTPSLSLSQKKEQRILIDDIITFIEAEISPTVQDYCFMGKLDKVLNTIQNECNARIAEIQNSANNSLITSDEDKQRLEAVINKFSKECSKSTSDINSILGIVTTLRIACHLEALPGHSPSKPLKPK